MEVGVRLREAREEQGVTLAQVEQATRIRRVFLEAIEEERFDALPGEVYVKGFIRNYAQFLGLDPEPLLEGFGEQQTTATLIDIPDVLDEPLMHRVTGSIGPRLFLGFVVLVVLATAGWYVYTSKYLGLDPREVVSDLLASRGVPVQTPLPPEPERTPIPTRVREMPTVMVAETPAEISTAAPEEPTDRPGSKATATPSPTVSVGILIEAHILAETYVEVTTDGELSYVAILEAGQDQVWTAENVITLRLGNAGGIDLMVNGVEVGVPGMSGEVLEVEYTLDNLPTPQE